MRKTFTVQAPIPGMAVSVSTIVNHSPSARMLRAFAPDSPSFISSCGDNASTFAGMIALLSAASLKILFGVYDRGTLRDFALRHFISAGVGVSGPSPTMRRIASSSLAPSK
jgi:hypothetical protein